MKLKKLSILSGIVKTVSVITVITVISKILGLFREVGIASIFGLGIKTDAFYAAIIIPTILFTSIGVAIKNLFMIEFTKYKKDHPERYDQSLLSSNVIHILLVLSTVFFILSFLFTPTIVRLIAPGFDDPDKFNLTVRLTRILLPTMLIIPIYQIKASVLKTYDKFVTVSIIDLGFNLFQITYLILFSHVFDIVGLAYSITFAYLSQLVVIEVISYKMGFRNRKILDFKDKHWLNIFRLFIPTLISFGIIQINALVDKILASSLDDGAITALNYGFMIRNLLYGIIIATVLMVVYPILLKHKTDEDEDAFNDISSKTIQFLWIVALPMTFLLLIFNQEIIQIIFQRGAFTPQDVLLTSRVMFYYLIGMTSFALKEFFVHVSYAHQNSKFPLYVTLIGVVLNITLSITLRTYMGVYGIALGLSISEVISLILMVYLIYKNKYLTPSRHAFDMVKIVLINLMIFVPLWMFKNLLYLPDTNVFLALVVGFYGLIVLCIYVLLNHLFKIRLMSDFIISIGGGGDE